MTTPDKPEKLDRYDRALTAVLVGSVSVLIGVLVWVLATGDPSPPRIMVLCFLTGAFVGWWKARAIRRWLFSGEE